MDRSAIETPFASLGGAFQNMSGQKAFQSPFLQVDPSIIGSPNQIASEFIFPDGGSKPSRGRFELAFSQIGGTILVGGGIGGALGALRGFREIVKMTDKPLTLKRTHMLNMITRNGASVANTFGTISLLYSAIGVGMSFVQDENDDLNTALAATTTGVIYGGLSSSKKFENLTGSALNKMRLKRAGFGFAFGLLAAATLMIVMDPDKYRRQLNQYH